MTHDAAMPNAGTVTPDLWERWRMFARTAFGVEITDEAADRFRVYLEELLDWNRRINLVSVRSAEEVLWRHFADSLAGLAAAGLPASARPDVIDIGTGAGFPGIPVKIARPSWPVTLVESITKKTQFLEHLLDRLALSDASVINDRAEILGRDARYRERFDLLFSRAVTKFSPNLEIALPLLKTGGRALIYKTGRCAAAEGSLENASSALALLGGRPAGTFDYRLPNEELGYTVLIIEKTGATPEQYPRRPGMPEKRPL